MRERGYEWTDGHCNVISSTPHPHPDRQPSPCPKYTRHTHHDEVLLALLLRVGQPPGVAPVLEGRLAAHDLYTYIDIVEMVMGVSERDMGGGLALIPSPF